VARKPLVRGDLIKVTWLDIQEDPVGDPNGARPSERVTYGLFWAQEVRGQVECLVTTTTIDNDSPHQSGYCVYPIGCILTMDVIKRAK